MFEKWGGDFSRGLVSDAFRKEALKNWELTNEITKKVWNGVVFAGYTSAVVFSLAVGGLLWYYKPWKKSDVTAEQALTVTMLKKMIKYNGMLLQQSDCQIHVPIEIKRDGRAIYLLSMAEDAKLADLARAGIEDPTVAVAVLSRLGDELSRLDHLEIIRPGLLDY